jgi:hypothetical protein
MCQVIRWPFGRPVSPLDQKKLLKLFGYNWGGPGVDAILRLFATPPVIPDDLGALDLATLTSLREQLGIKVLVQIMATPAEALTTGAWQQLSLRWRAVMAAAKTGRGDQGTGLSLSLVTGDMLAFLSEGKVESTTAAQAAGAISPSHWRDAAWSGRAGAAG